MSSLTNNPPQQCRWHSFDTIADLEQAATQAILQAASQAINLRGAFHIVLAGGTTPRHVYSSLRHADTDWAAWHIYFGDERCLPADHVERNSLMATQAWLDHVAIPPSQIHCIPAENAPYTAADAYTKTLKNIDLFDLVLLGIGEDGHTASLFPGQDSGTTADSPDVIVVENAPKYPPQRISLSAHRLSAARKVIFLVSGTAKQQAVKNWREGAMIPVSTINPVHGVDIYLETALLT